jgi:hypothetical protein
MSPLVHLTWILALGIGAQWLAWRIKLRSIPRIAALRFTHHRGAPAEVTKVFSGTKVFALAPAAVTA